MNKNAIRVRYSTTLEEETLEDLELIKIELNLDAKNDVIEYLTANYRGKKYEQYKNKRNKQKRSRANS